MENKKTQVNKGLSIKERIPFLEGRPEREYVITHDNIIDLAILLNTTNSAEDFIAALE